MTSSTAFRTEDFRWMGRALELAERGAGLTSPNPLVGAVVVATGRAVGEGFHARAGGPHAEIEALAKAGDAARGATLYVTLEPCNHTGRTPPCADAVKRAGIQRVVAAMADPNLRVVGGGAAALSNAGIGAFLGCREREALLLNRAFVSSARWGRPHVTLKWAATMDGKIADGEGRSKWITGRGARLEAHRLRSQADAVVVGIGTALADDPALDVRLGAPWPREPLRVVVDSTGRLPVASRVIRGSEGTGRPERAVIAVTDAADPARLAALEARGVTVLRCKAHDGRVDVVDLLARLGALDAIGVLLEGGSQLAGAFLEAGVVDRVVAFSAPVLLGGARAPGTVGGLGLSLPHGVRLEGVAIRPVECDWVIEGDVRRGSRP